MGNPQTNPRQVANAKRLMSLADQCEHPIGRDECCTNLTRRNRLTSRGTMWLCSGHFCAPEDELFGAAVVEAVQA